MPFVKGQSGNPAGRKKSETPTADLMRRRLAMRPNPGDPTEREAIIGALFSLAKGGDVNAIKVIFDRTEGKVPEPVHVSGPDGGPLVIRWADADPD